MLCPAASAVLAMRLHLTIPAGFVYPPSSFSSWLAMVSDQTNQMVSDQTKKKLMLFCHVGGGSSSTVSFGQDKHRLPQGGSRLLLLLCQSPFFTLSLVLLVKGSH